MELPILIEPTPDGRFRARVGDPFHASAEAADPQHAIQALAQAVEKHLRSGATLAVLTIANGGVQAAVSPFPADDAYQSDWVYRELNDAIAEVRRLEDAAGP